MLLYMLLYCHMLLHILVYMCPHASICSAILLHATTVLLYMLLYTATNCYRLLLILPHATITGTFFFGGGGVLKWATVRMASLLYMCPDTAMYVLVLRYLSYICVLILVYTAIDVS